MKLKILLIIAMIFIVPLIYATCTNNNEFIIGDDIVICSGDCIYNDTNNLIDCDGNVGVFFSAQYPNGSFIIKNQPMNLENSHFEYNLTGDLLVNVSGEYAGNFRGVSPNGITEPIDFIFSISSTSIIPTTSAGTFAPPQTASSIEFGKLRKEIEDKIKKLIKEEKGKLALWFVFAFAGGFFLFTIIRELKKRKLIFLSKEVSQMMGKQRRKR